VLEADIILHVRDIAHEESDAQKQDVEKVLEELGIDEDERTIVEVLNKIDLLEPDLREALLRANRAASRKSGMPEIAASALTGQGIDDLLQVIDHLLGSAERVMRLTLDPGDGAAVAWAYENGRVIDRRYTDKAIYLMVAADDAVIDRFSARFPRGLEVIEHARRRA
jgi:GTP-binding protein HflX